MNGEYKTATSHAQAPNVKEYVNSHNNVFSMEVMFGRGSVSIVMKELFFSLGNVLGGVGLIRSISVGFVSVLLAL